MKFISTRGRAQAATLSEALRNGAAPDGGLYVPSDLPVVDVTELNAEAPLAEFAASLLQPFFLGDELEA